MSHLRIPALALAGLLGIGMSVGASAQNSQQMLMKHCNADASAKHLAGHARQDFMRTCLSSRAKRHAPLNSQQRRMSDCSAQAKAKGLRGTDRSHFMSSCLRTH